MPGDHGLEYRDVEFTTPDGVTLSGWYVPSANRAAVVLLHGAGSTRLGVLDHAVVLARHGYGVLLFDARGHGRSGGRAMDFGWYGDDDVAPPSRSSSQQPDVDAERIGAVGMSMGGEEAIGAAAADPTDPRRRRRRRHQPVAADKAWLSDEFGWRGTLQEGIEWLTFTPPTCSPPPTQPIALRDAVDATAPRPVLLIAAGERADEGTAGRECRAPPPTAWNSGSCPTPATPKRSRRCPPSGRPVSARSRGRTRGPNTAGR